MDRFPVSCVLMASGVSQRYGGENKLTALFHGRPLISHFAASAAQVPFWERVAVIRHHEVEALLPADFRVVHNDTPDLSVCRTIRLAVEALSSESLGAMFAVGDQPLLTARSLRRICEAFLRSPERIVALSSGGRRGNPILFPASLYSELASLNEGQSGRAVLERHRELLTLVEADSPQELCDIDTVQQLMALSQ